LIEDYLLRDLAERAMSNLFNLRPLRYENRAEFHLKTSNRLPPIEFQCQDNPDSLNDSLPKLIADLCNFCSDSAETISENDSDPQTRFTLILRTLRLSLIRCRLSNDLIWTFFIAVANSPARGGCNLCEFIHLFAQFHEEDRVQLLSSHADEFIQCVFPIQFKTDLQLSMITFIEALELSCFLLTNLKQSAAFCESYRNFFNFLLKNSAYLWGLTRMVTLVSKNRLSCHFWLMTFLFQ
jgi:hypothetical protein